jgi:hypothetical protein
MGRWVLSLLTAKLVFYLFFLQLQKVTITKVAVLQRLYKYEWIANQTKGFVHDAAF